MTKEDWKKVEDWWGDLYRSPVELQIDNYNVSLYSMSDREKMILCVVLYVDGVCKAAYADKDNEIGNRFYQRVKKPFYSAKELKDRQKTFGKRSRFAKQCYCEYNVLYWRSFAAFKRHIIANNKSIELIIKK